MRSADSGRLGEPIPVERGIDEDRIRFSGTKRWYLMDLRGEEVDGPFAVHESFSGEEIFRDRLIGDELYWRGDRFSYRRPTDPAGPMYMFEGAGYVPGG